LLAGAFVVLFLSLVGIPLTGGFFGKLLLSGAAIDAGLFYLAIAIALNSAISLGYYFGAVRRMYLATAEAAGADSSRAEPETFRLDFGTGLAVITSVVVVLALGFLPGVFLPWIERAAQIMGS